MKIHLSPPIKRKILICSLAILPLWIYPPELQSQEQEENIITPFTDFLGEAFDTEQPEATSSARIGAWNPDTGIGYIVVHYIFPDTYHQTDSEEYFTIRAKTEPGIIFGAVMKAEPLYADGLAQYYDETSILRAFHCTPDADIETLSIEALYQLCDESGTCLLPASKPHEITFKPSMPKIEADATVQEIIRWNEELSRTEENINPPLWLFLLMALCGGILLNVMPCVLPLLSVKALGLVKQAGSERKFIRRHAWLYVAGIEVSFWIMAAIIILVQASGKLLGWGFQFQSPGFLIILISLLWIFALSLFDVFIIEAPNTGFTGAKGYLGSFLTGFFAVIVATPCTAPFLGSALGFAFTQPPVVIFLIFSVTGLGLGLPFFLMGFWPRFIERFPKPGNWMNTFKELMGFLLLATIVYLMASLNHLAPGAIGQVLWCLLILAFAAWLLGRARRPEAKRWFRIGAQILVVGITLSTIFALINIPSESSNTVSRTTQEHAFNEADILARIDRGETIFLEFTAQWCSTCKLNQRVLKNKKVQALMKDKNILHIKGDLTGYDETLTRWLGKFNRVGVPLYVLYEKDKAPYVFPEILSMKLIEEKFSAVKDSP